ncbi:MAG: YncE family protein, partial [Gemmatimonadota bacterium]
MIAPSQRRLASRALGALLLAGAAGLTAGTPRSAGLGWAVPPPARAPAEGTAAFAEPRTPESPPPLLYVCSQSAAIVSVIDMEKNEVVASVDLQSLGFTARASPHHIAVEPDGSYWYVSLIGDGVVAKLDRDNRLVGVAEFEAPGLLALDPRSDRLYVGRSMAAVRPPRRIGLIRRSDMSVEEVDVFVPRPHAIAVGPTGAHIYVASLGQNRMVILDATEEEGEIASLQGPFQVLVQFAVSPDGRWLVGTGQITGRLIAFDISEPGAPRVARTVQVGEAPWHPVFGREGRYVYVPNQADNSVSVVDATTWEVAAVVEGEGLAEPHGSAVSPDGRFVYISNHNLKREYAPAGSPGRGDVVVIDARTRRIVKVIDVPPYASGIGTASPA